MFYVLLTSLVMQRYWENKPCKFKLLVFVCSRSRRLSLKLLRRQFSWSSSRRPQMYSTDSLAKLTSDKLNIGEHNHMSSSGMYCLQKQLLSYRIFCRHHQFIVVVMFCYARSSAHCICVDLYRSCCSKRMKYTNVCHVSCYCMSVVIGYRSH